MNKEISFFSKQNLIFIQVLIFLFFSFFGLLGIFINKPTLFYLLSLSIVFHFFWSVYTWKRVVGTYFDPYILFLISAFLFNAGYTLLTVFLSYRSFSTFSTRIIGNAFNLVFNYKGFGIGVIIKTYYFILLSFVCFHLGVLVSVSTKVINKSKKLNITLHENADSLNGIKLTGLFLFLISFVPLLLIYKNQISISLREGYSGTFMGQDVSTGFSAIPQRLATFFIPSVYYILAGSNGKKNLESRIALALMLTYSFVTLFIGSRVWALTSLVSFLWFWHIYVAPIKRSFFLIGIVSFFLIIPVIAITRDLAFSSRFSIETIYNSLFGIANPFFLTLLEMGSTIQINIYTIALMPNVWGFQWGLGYFYSFLTIIPNLFWNIHPSAQYQSLADKIIWHVNPRMAAEGGGWGSSFIAEGYFNFGWISLIVFILMGFIIFRTIYKLKSSNRTRNIVIIISFIPYLLYFARAELSILIRGFFWYCLFPYILSLFFTFISKYSSKISI